MAVLVRNIVAVVCGVVIGSMVNMGVIVVGQLVVPPPEGIDLSDMDRLAENLKLLRPIDFAAPWLAHALGTLVGASIAARIAASHPMALACGIGGFFLAGGVAMVWMYGGPAWFVVLDLAGAYLPMAYWGGKLGGMRQTCPS